MKLIAYLLLIVVGLSVCNKQNDNGNITLKEFTTKAQKAGYNVTYKESLKVDKPDLSKFTDPYLFGKGECGLDDDTEFIRKLEEISKTNDIVPTADVAIRIAVAAWNNIYGKDKIENEKPYHAELKDSIWYVSGSLHKGMDFGGTAEAEILKKTGKILRIIHGK
jgi:hypothetical protein